MSLQGRLTFRDLQQKRIVNNRATLRNWVKKGKFPPGKLTGPNSRTWGEDEIVDYIDDCPTDPKPAPRRPAQSKSKITDDDKESDSEDSDDDP